MTMLDDLYRIKAAEDKTAATIKQLRTTNAALLAALKDATAALDNFILHQGYHLSYEDVTQRSKVATNATKVIALARKEQ